jgi:O-acetyl-ADP-ribose deacetylase (regulator of RNase III)
MMADIEITRGDLLKSDAEALVNTVNCVGVMGKGVALQFKRAFPENFRIYKRACDAHEVTPGKVLVVDCAPGSTPRYIINFPTKVHWRGDSRLAWIQSGLTALIREIRSRGIKSIAVPPLGCGNGGLDWADVRPMIEAAFASVPGIRVLLFEPAGAPSPDSMEVRTKRPRLTRARAILIRLLEAYGQVEGRLTKLEVQKLAYFLQAAGEALRLQFVKHKYGPYAEKLNFVLQDLEGHYLRGYGDRTVSSQLHLMPGAVAAADQILRDDHVARERLERVRTLIAGFESPYGMELLATVHWVACHDAAARSDVSRAVVGVMEWSARKKERYRESHVVRSWHRLKDQGWFESMDDCQNGASEPPPSPGDRAGRESKASPHNGTNSVAKATSLHTSTRRVRQRGTGRPAKRTQDHV